MHNESGLITAPRRKVEEIEQVSVKTFINFQDTELDGLLVGVLSWESEELIMWGYIMIIRRK